MSAATQRTCAWLLLAGLVLTAVLAGVVPDFPRGVAAATGWSALVHSGAALAHAVLGSVVLVAAGALVVAATPRVAAVVTAAGCLGAVAAGVAYVTRGESDAALTAMTVGWLVALAGSVVLVVQARRRVRADGPPR